MHVVKRLLMTTMHSKMQSLTFILNKTPCGLAAAVIAGNHCALIQET